MTLSDLEHQNRDFAELFAILGCDTHFKSEYAEIAEDRPGQPAYEIFLSIEHTF